MTTENFETAEKMVGPIILLLSLFLFGLETVLYAQPLPSDRIKHGIRNLLISVLNIQFLALGGALVIAVSVFAQNIGVGGLNWLGLQGNLAFVLSGILVYDLLNYFIHRSLHFFSYLWRTHRVHHTDHYLDVTSSFYFNPIESVYRFTIQIIFVVLVGLPPATLVGYSIWVVSALLLSHSNIRIHPKIEKMTKYFLVLPTAHRVHHSNVRNEHDSNFGIGFMMWDHIFRTYTAPDNQNQFRIGLNDYAGKKLTLVETLTDPFKNGIEK